METAVEVNDLAKRYRPGLLGRVVGGRTVHALSGVSLRARRGEIFGLLGPNGAGKSTLVKSILGLVRPTRGGGQLLGRPLGDRVARLEVGYLPEQAKFPPYLTGRQVVEFFAGLGGLSRGERKRRAAALLDRVELDESARNRRVKGYSKGMRQRVGLACALAAGGPGGPKLIVLDEPTDGVDPIARRLIRDVLVEARDAGTCVFINSHLLGELELICSRAAVLVNGQVATSGTLEELGGGRGRYEVEIQPDADLAAATLANPTAVAARLADVLGVHWGPAPDGQPRARFAVPGAAYEVRLVGETTMALRTIQPAKAQPLLDALRRGGITVKRFAPVRPTLEDLFIDTVHAHQQHAGDGPAVRPHAAHPPHRPPMPQAEAVHA